MKNKGNLIAPLVYALTAVIGILTVLSFVLTDDKTLRTLAVILFALSAAAVILLSQKLKSDVNGYLSRLAVRLGRSKAETQNVVPAPVVTLNRDYSVMWYNNEFLEKLLGGCEAHAVDISRIFKGVTHEQLEPGARFTLRHEKRFYDVSVVSDNSAVTSQCMMFFTDITERKKLEISYENSRPAVILIVFDNEDELMKMRESERMTVLTAVDSLIRGWVKDTTGICRSDARATSLIVVDEQQLKNLIQDKFSILSEARKIPVSGDQQVTLSIGVGRGGATLSECESWAQSALDMALGRGGDQAVVKKDGEYTFFGGVSKSSEKQSKVKARMLAKDIAGMIGSSDKCIVMGHRFSDLDAMGAAIGVMSIARSLGVESWVVCDRQTTLAETLVDYYIDHTEDMVDRFVPPDEAMAILSDKSTLVIVDTHSKDILDNHKLYEMAKKVIVIDHHRMMVSRVEHADIFFHEPFASSASEMVAEIAQYTNEKAISRVEAEALLAGIMLDTKSFVVKTGVRTFEAATFLRRRGADTVDVKLLFAGSLEDYAERSKIVASATTYGDCAISQTSKSIDNIRVVASQAADEMLNLKGVNASFVLYSTGSTVNISARSLGKLNVQLIMEKLGGGGHMTMAAAQIRNESTEKVIQMLHEAIDTVSSERYESEE